MRILHLLPHEVETSEMIWHYHLELQKIQSGRQSRIPREKMEREGEREGTRPKKKRDDKRWERIGSEIDIKPRVHVGKQFGYCPNKSALFLMWMPEISGRRDETAFLWRVFFRCSICYSLHFHRHALFWMPQITLLFEQLLSYVSIFGFLVIYNRNAYLDLI